jgi:hypothetical protein
MPRKKRTFAGEIAGSVQALINDTLKQLEPTIEDMVLTRVSQHFGLPTGDDIVEQHVQKLVTEHKSRKASGTRKKRATKRKTKAKASPQKRTTRKVKAKAGPKKKAPAKKAQAKTKSKARPKKAIKAKTKGKSNGTGDSTYNALRQQVLDQRQARA